MPEKIKKKIFFVPLVWLFSMCSMYSHASVTGTFLSVDWSLCRNLPSINSQGWDFVAGSIYTLTGNTHSNTLPTSAWADCQPSAMNIRGGNMNLGTAYVPKSGKYSIVLFVCNKDAGFSCGPDNKIWSAPITYKDYLSATVPLSSQPMTANSAIPPYISSGAACYALVAETGETYSIPSKGASCAGSGVAPIPPEPVVTSTCTINDGNVLNVNLGSVDRALLATTPGTGQLIHIQVPVECTSSGEATDMSVNMQLSYTPLTVSGTEVVQSSTNGLGVSIIYNNQPLSPTDITPLTFLIGSNSLDLAFEAVREPSVNIGDISTGEFTASAVLMMTQQ